MVGWQRTSNIGPVGSKGERGHASFSDEVQQYPKDCTGDAVGAANADGGNHHLGIFFRERRACGGAAIGGTTTSFT